MPDIWHSNSGRQKTNRLKLRCIQNSGELVTIQLGICRLFPRANQCQ